MSFVFLLLFLLLSIQLSSFFLGLSKEYMVLSEIQNFIYQGRHTRPRRTRYSISLAPVVFPLRSVEAD